MITNKHFGVLFSLSLLCIAGCSKESNNPPSSSSAKSMPAKAMKIRPGAKAAPMSTGPQLSIGAQSPDFISMP